MKVILPVFLALCLGIMPVFCREAPAYNAETLPAEESGQSDAGAAAGTSGSFPLLTPEATDADVNAAAAASAAVSAEEESLSFGSDVPQFSMVRAAGGLGLVLCLLIGAYFCIRKFAPGYFPGMKPEGKNLKIVESLSMGERRSIALVEVGEQRFLIGSTPQQINLLTVLPGHISFVAEDDKARGAAEASAVKAVKKEEGEKQAFRNLFKMGEPRSGGVRRADVIPDEVRRKMQRLRDAMENR